MGDVRQLRGGKRVYGWSGRGGGMVIRSCPQFPAICGRCPVESGAVAFHALTGIWRQIAFRETRSSRSFTESCREETGAFCPGVGPPVPPHLPYVVWSAAPINTIYSDARRSGAGQGAQ
ncbi:hypothetical protein DU290_25945 [Escherichia coli]|nr:hypothetical protein DU290_25945 [Escherichia coli]